MNLLLKRTQSNRTFEFEKTPVEGERHCFIIKKDLETKIKMIKYEFKVIKEIKNVFLILYFFQIV